MKILIFAPFYPPHIGGVENYTQELADELSKRGVHLLIFTPHIPDSSPAHETIGTIEVVRFPAFEIIRNYPLPKFWSGKFWKPFLGLWKQSFDVTISETRFFITSLLAMAYAKTNKTAWAHIEHGSDFITVSSPVTNAVARAYDTLIGSIILRSSDINISISNAVRSFIRRFDDRNSPIIYRGLNLVEIDKAVPNTKLRNVHAGKTIIAYTGRLYKWKGVENSIKAVLSLPENIKRNIVFVIAGDGEEFERLHRMKDDSVIMLGAVSREDVFGIQKVADIFIHSALPGGGLATSLLEAMYCGCAVVATPNEGATDVIRSGINGVLIEESDPDLIRSAIEDLMADKTRMNSYAENAHDHVREAISWEASADSLLEIFKSLKPTDAL